MDNINLPPIYTDHYSDESIQVAHGCNKLIGLIVDSIFPITGMPAMPQIEWTEQDKNHLHVKVTSPNIFLGHDEFDTHRLVRDLVQLMLPTITKSPKKGQDISGNLKAMFHDFIEHSVVTVKGPTSFEKVTVSPTNYPKDRQMDMDSAVILLQTYMCDGAIVYMTKCRDISKPFEIILEYTSLPSGSSK